MRDRTRETEEEMTVQERLKDSLSLEKKLRREVFTYNTGETKAVYKGRRGNKGPLAYPVAG